MGMIGPGGIAVGVGIAMLAVTVASIVRIVGARITGTATDWAIDGCHAVMGVSMAGMLIPGLGIVQPGASTLAWVIVSALIAAWFGISVLRDLLATHPDRVGGIRRLHHLPHLVLSGAMVYMLIVMGDAVSGRATAGTDMSGMGVGTALPLPTLDIALAFFMIGYTVVLVDRLPAMAALGGVGQPRPLSGGSEVVFAPRSAAAAGIVMATGMAYMLIMMFA